ncbi:nucleic acid-binding, OB-fold protein [Tanacetum coccineum]
MLTISINVHDSLVEPNKEMMMVDYSQPREGTVENLLLWARNHKNDTVTFQCKVMIKDIRRKSGWNYPSCGGEKCRKSVSRKAGKFLCETCNRTVDYPVFRSELEDSYTDEVLCSAKDPHEINDDGHVDKKKRNM